jgi:hypothetical protein
MSFVATGFVTTSLNVTEKSLKFFQSSQVLLHST